MTETETKNHDIVDICAQLRNDLNLIMRDCGDLIAHFHKSYVTAGDVQLFAAPPQRYTATLGKTLHDFEQRIDTIVNLIEMAERKATEPNLMEQQPTISAQQTHVETSEFLEMMDFLQ